MMDSNGKVGKITKKESISAHSPQRERASTVKRAAAISYDPEKDDAPVLAAFGEGHLAEKIVEIAKESGVPVLPDPGLSSMLSRMSVGDEIPEELYEAVAKVLLYVSEIDKNYGNRLKAYGMLDK